MNKHLEIAWRVDIGISKNSPIITVWFKTKKQGEDFIDRLALSGNHIASSLMPYKPIIVWENSYPTLKWELLDNFGGNASITIS